MRVWWDEFSKTAKCSDPNYPNGRPLSTNPTVTLDGRPLKMVQYADDEEGVVQAIEAVEKDCGSLLGTQTTLVEHTLHGRVEITLPREKRGMFNPTKLAMFTATDYGFTAVRGY